MIERYAVCLRYPVLAGTTIVGDSPIPFARVRDVGEQSLPPREKKCQIGIRLWMF